MSEGYQSPTKSRDLEKQVTATESKICNLADVLSHGYLASSVERSEEEERRLRELRALIDVNYFCRLATIRTAGRDQVALGPV